MEGEGSVRITKNKMGKGLVLSLFSLPVVFNPDLQLTQRLEQAMSNQK